MPLARVILSVILIAGVGGLLWVDHRLQTDIGFIIIMFCAVVLAVQEFYDLAKHKGYTPYFVWGIVCAGLMVLADWLGYRNFHPEMHWLGIVAFTFLAGLFVLQGWLLPRKQGVISMAVTAFGIAYVWGLGHFILRIRYLEPDVVGIRGVLMLVVVVKLSDIIAYAVGSLWGRHRPFPQISPQKSWEGYLGGLVGALLAGVLAGWLLFDMSWYLALIFSLPVCIAGNLGDLAESIIKRDLGAKDSGVRFPGLGGVLDVFDSLLVAGPVAFYIFEQMVIMDLLRR